MTVKNEFDINNFSVKGLRNVTDERGRNLLKGSVYLKGKKVGTFVEKEGAEAVTLEFLDSQAHALYQETEEKWNQMLRVFYKDTPLEEDHLHNVLVEVLIDLKKNFDGPIKKAVLQGDYDYYWFYKQQPGAFLDKIAVQPKEGLTEAAKAQIETDGLIPMRWGGASEMAFQL